MTIGRIIDVSSDQHPNDVAINWQLVAGAGVTAVFVKATQGTTYINPWFQRDMIAAQKAGLAVCAYHFADMGDPLKEAQFFAKTAARFARVLDFETNTNVAWARTFLQTLILPPDECMTYGSASTLKDFYQQLPSMAWVAAYGQFYPGWGACWQFTDKSSIPGITGDVDEDSWHGSELAYETLFQLNVEPPEPPQPIPEGSEEMDSVVAPNGDIVSHYRTPANHLLEVTRKAGDQGEAASQGLSIIDITQAYPQFQVAS